MWSGRFLTTNAPAGLTLRIGHHACPALSSLPMCRPGAPVSMKAARATHSVGPGNSSPEVLNMYPTDLSLTHAQLSQHLDALRREAAQIREVARQVTNSRPPGVFARLRQVLARSRQPEAAERKAGAAPR